MGLSLSLHCSGCLGTLHSTTLGISTIFSIALGLIISSSCSFPCCWVCSFACSWLCSFTFLGSRVPSLAVFSFESIHACTACARHRGRCPRGHRSRSCEALFPRASRPTSLTSSLPSRAAWLIRPTSSRLLFVARLQLRTRLLQSSLHSLDLVPRGRRALLDQFRTV